ncbi:MAG: Twin-arginine translocation pathway signal sequence domain-containing protein [Planctomycetota bacterium]|nr:MAG: Twin-arginine translocation pathway signal sequence domain-containing protein [Planctomycetota bacterium]
MMDFDRRTFLRLGSAACLPLMFPGVRTWALDEETASNTALGDRVLILVELQGGNDGLNTVIPYRDERYKKLRPRIAVADSKVMDLGNHLGMHDALSALGESWEASEMCWILGLGYPEPNRSHFRSIEIWETGSDSDEELTDGWLSRLLSGADKDPTRAADGIVLGGGDAGPFYGATTRVIHLDDPASFARQARQIPEIARGMDARKALGHLLDVQEDVKRAALVIEQKRASAPALGVKFPTSRFGKRCEIAATLVAAGVPCPLIKLSHGGFDTHTDQPRRHPRLLGELAQGLAALRKALIQSGDWGRVLISTYSEFGRRAKENGNQGTDHGTAAPHLMMGGQVKGGFAGSQPDLGQLQKNDLIYTTDYRRLYATIEQQWFQMDPNSKVSRGQSPLAILRGKSL